MDPLPSIIPPAQFKEPPPKSDEGYGNFDIGLISLGAGAFFATQVFSRTYPHLAGEVSKNVIGPKLVLGKGQFEYSLTGRALIPAPAPFGYAPPTLYGLEPNYVGGLNKTLRYDLGLPTWIGIPESHMLKTLSDTDPITRQEQYQALADEQRRALETYTLSASRQEVERLLLLAETTPRGALFFEPEQIVSSLRVTLAARGGQPPAPSNAIARALAELEEVDTDLLQFTVPRGLVGETADLLASGNTTIRPVLGAAAPDEPPLTFSPRLPLNPTEGLEVRTGLVEHPNSVAAALGLPAETLQQQAQRQAPEPMKHLATERNDP
jgi:hypothetical protein